MIVCIIGAYVYIYIKVNLENMANNSVQSNEKKANKKYARRPC